MTKSAWTDHRVGRLKTLWLEGRTAEQIARELQNGISRSAVLGKVHRLGLSAGRPGRPPASRTPAPRPRRENAMDGPTKRAATGPASLMAHCARAADRWLDDPDGETRPVPVALWRSRPCGLLVLRAARGQGRILPRPRGVGLQDAAGRRPVAAQSCRPGLNTDCALRYECDDRRRLPGGRRLAVSSARST